jgi:hypothetical protein
MHPIQKLFASNEMIFNTNLGGVTHADSVIKPEQCNCINWIVGHIVYSRNGVMTALNQPQVTDASFKPIYDRYTNMQDTSTALSLDELIKLYKGSQARIIDNVISLKDGEVMDRVTFLGFHEAYHLGQIGIVRKLIGKKGAI